MTIEYDSKSTEKAFEDISELFNKFPETEGAAQNYRSIELEGVDHIKINILKTDSPERPMSMVGVEGFYLTIFSNGDKSGEYSTVFSFGLNRNGLTDLDSPQMTVATGDKKINFQKGISINHYGSLLGDDNNKKTFRGLSVELVNWVQGVIDSKRYTSPPVVIMF